MYIAQKKTQWNLDSSNNSSRAVILVEAVSECTSTGKFRSVSKVYRYYIAKEDIFNSEVIYVV